MANHSFQRGPRFAPGDRVQVVGPDSNKGRQGAIEAVIEGSGDFVYRYDVRFPDGASSRYFGFELELARKEEL